MNSTHLFVGDAVGGMKVGTGVGGLLGVEGKGVGTAEGPGDGAKVGDLVGSLVG